MAKSSDIIKIGFDYRSSLEQFEKETNGVFDGISGKAGKQRISIQLDAKNDKVIEKIKELQKLKLDKFTFEFGESGSAEQLKTFDQLVGKINEIINLSKGINSNNGIGNSIVDEKSLNDILDLFKKIESHLGEIKKVFSDVGDGKEFSPLLSTIDKINTSISELSTSVKGIGLNMNIDVGSDSEAEAKVQSKISNALQAYERLFKHIKMSSAGGSIINQKFFEFDINQYDTMMGKLQAYKKFIGDMRKEAKEIYGQDVLYQDTDKSYWNATSAAMGQVTRIFNKMDTSSDTSPLENLFGKTDLSEVISQLGQVVDKLNEISTTTSGFKDLLSNELDVNHSVEEIEKLTSRVKELEDELEKIKISPTVDGNKSNIPSDNIANQIADKENSDHDYWQKEFERTIKELSSPQENPVLDDMRKFYQDQDKENSKIWNDNLNKIKEYLDARTKLNKLESANVGKGDTENIIRQRSEVKRLEEEAENARATLSKLFSPYKRGETPDDAWIEMMKNFRQATDGSEESVAKLHDSINKFNASELQTIDKYIESAQKKLDSTKSSRVGSEKSSSFKTYEKEVQECINALIVERDKLENAVKSGDIEIIDEEFLSNFNKLKQELEETNSGFKTMFKGSAEVSRWKEIDTITKYMEKNTRISKEAKDKLREYIETLKTNGADANVEEIHKAFLRVCDVERKAKREGQSFLDVLRNKVWYQWAAQIGGYFGFNDIIRYAKEGIQTVREFDTALTEMRKVSDESVQSLKNYQAVTFDVANEVGATAVQIQNSTSDWMRLGESIDEAAESAKASNILLNVSEFDNIDSATESLIAMSSAYKDLDKMDIIDVMNKIGNEYSISTDGIATALQDSASSLITANNDLYEATALITAGNAVTQDPSKVGSGLRTIALRLTGTEAAKEDLAEMGEDTDTMITSVSKLQETIKQATAAASLDGKGFDILDANGNYKSTFEIMKGLAGLYDEIVAKDKELGTNNLNLLLETIAGKNRSNIAASILQNGDMLESVFEDAQDAEGSALEENEKYLDSIDGKMQQLSNQAQEFWFKLIDSEFIKTCVDLLTDLLSLLTKIVDKAGLLGTIGIGAGLFAGIKNVGITMLVA